LKKKTLIVVPNTYLLTQWVDLLKEFFPNNKIGQYYGKQKEDGDIVVAIINSLINDNFTFTSTKLIEIEEIKGKKKIKKIKIKKEKEIITKSYKEYFKEFGFVILDESHIYCTDSFKVAYNRFQSTYMLGLSATPNERNNNCDIISHLNIGKVLIASEIEKYKNDDTKFTAEVSVIKYNGPDKYTNVHINETTKMICVPKIIEELVNDEYRNKLIIDQIYELFDLKLNIFVFSERRSHLEYLHEQFNYLLDDKDIDKNVVKNNISIPELDINKNIVLYGNSSDEDINVAKTNSNVIFTTFAYSSTGVSINRMTALVLTTPRRSKSIQIIGRIFRLNKENTHIKRVIVDIVDNKTVLKNQLYERMKAYKDRDAEIKKKEINYSDIKF
jgi:superfamily II DNA or RNA helicase